MHNNIQSQKILLDFPSVLSAAFFDLSATNKFNLFLHGPDLLKYFPRPYKNYVNRLQGFHAFRTPTCM